MRSDFDNAGWVEAHLKKQLTPFQKRVAEIVGIIGSNAYNAPVKWEKVDWEYGGRAVSLVWGNGHLATFDFMPLTTLVFLCHDARIRLQIEPAGPRGLRLSFWQRQATGSMSKRHPDLEEAIADHRDWLPPGHPIFYRNHPEREFEKAAAAMGAANVDPQVLSGCAVRAEIQREQTAAVLEANDGIAESLGFADQAEFHRLVAGADVSTPARLAAFKAWQADDGTKSGLLALAGGPGPVESGQEE